MTARGLSFRSFLRVISVKMNVIAKSTTVSPFLRATATVVSNGGIPVAATGKVHKPKVTVPPTVKRALGQTLYQDLLTGPTCISSGVAGASLLSTIRSASILREHTCVLSREIETIRDYIINTRTLHIVTLLSLHM